MPIARLRTCLSAAAVVAAVAGAPSVARAQSGLPAFKQGRALVEAGRWAEACPFFEEGHRLEPKALGILLNLADCYKHVGKTASAWSAYQSAAFLAKRDGDGEREQYALRESAALEPRLSRLRIVVKEVPGLVVRRDDQDVGKGVWGTDMPIDPGPHTLEATAPGHAVWTTTLQIGAARDLKVIEIPALTRVAGPVIGGSAGPGLRIASFVLGGAGVAGLAVGGVFGGLAASAASSLKKSCGGGVCSQAQDQSSLSSAKAKAVVADVALGAGGGLVATGIVLFVLSRPTAQKDAAAASPRLVPGFGVSAGGGVITLSGAL